MLRISRHYVSRIVFVLLLFELFILFASAYLSTIFRFASKSNYFLLSVCTLAIALICCMSALGMYQHNFRDISKTALRIVPSLALALSVMIVVYYLVPPLNIGLDMLLILALIAAVEILLGRILFFKSSDLAPAATRILFLGSGPLAATCLNRYNEEMNHSHFQIVGFVPLPGEVSCVPATSVLAHEASLLETARCSKANEIVVLVDNRRTQGFSIDKLLECRLHGIKVSDAETFFEREACQIRVDLLHTSWLVFGSGFNQSAGRSFIKAVLDLLASIVLFALTLPLMLVAALCIYLEDFGPIFYRQERVGKDGHIFRILKFRSMRNDAEQSNMPQWAAVNDPRTTRVGRIMRKLRIDELPQLLNVAMGEMSFIGPRPERPNFVREFCVSIPYYNLRHNVKPGITGLAQVRYNYGASREDAVEKLHFDLYYVKNNSLFLDVLILIDTAQVVLFGKGGR